MSDLGRTFNHSRFEPGSAAGFYESYFQRANHPTQPQAFWIRYTIFSPAGRPQDALGELWAIFFDGETRRHVVAKTEVPAGQFAFSRESLDARVGSAMLRPGELRGAAESRGHRIEWDLRYAGGQPPLFLLDRGLYDFWFPKAKALVGVPMARFDGRLVVDGRAVEIAGWTGSQNHNWGSAHTDLYAYGQVAGFDGAPDAFLEVGTARVKVGPVRTPLLTTMVLRLDGEEFALNTIPQALFRAQGRFGYFHWTFRSARDGVVVEGEIQAPKDAFVGLRYYNPPGGEKWCLNSKIASCRLVVKRAGQADRVLEAKHRAAFEILTDDLGHGVEIRT